MATQTKAATTSGSLTCPECGRTFARPQALGAHRRQAHGVAGTSKNARARRPATATAGSRARRTRSAAPRTTAARRSRDGAVRSVNRDALLQAVFPNGIPPREGVIAAVNDWL